MFAGAECGAGGDSQSSRANPDRFCFVTKGAFKPVRRQSFYIATELFRNGR
jgi:hypothetical protein